ncbi:hypothetical protein GGR55DRAFT_554221 [Xylaria sp. FL0064]|nr:hypothetical protein GGR55DRAFT_554221 [Xylaria sp. FL0064]
MYNAKVLLSAAALAGSSMAQSATPTAFSTNSAACAASLTSFTDAPTPAPELASFFASVVGTGPVTAPGETTALPDFTLEDPDGYQALFCSVAAELPASLIPDYKSYGEGLLSYGSAHLSQYDAYITDCITTGSAASSLTSALHKMLDATGGGMCQTTSTAAPGGSSNGTYPTGTGSYTVSPSSTSTLIPTAAAARPTGAVLGAAALGGLLGAVALL